MKRMEGKKRLRLLPLGILAALTPDDIDVVVTGKKIPAKTVCNIKIIDIKNGQFIGEII